MNKKRKKIYMVPYTLTVSDAVFVRASSKENAIKHVDNLDLARLAEIAGKQDAYEGALPVEEDLVEEWSDPLDPQEEAD